MSDPNWVKDGSPGPCLKHLAVIGWSKISRATKVNSMSLFPVGVSGSSRRTKRSSEVALTGLTKSRLIDNIPIKSKIIKIN